MHARDMGAFVARYDGDAQLVANREVHARPLPARLASPLAVTFTWRGMPSTTGSRPSSHHCTAWYERGERYSLSTVRSTRRPSGHALRFERPCSRPHSKLGTSATLRPDLAALMLSRLSTSKPSLFTSSIGRQRVQNAL